MTLHHAAQISPWGARAVGVFALMLFAPSALGAAPGGAAAASMNEKGRVIVLGFDGADARTMERLMDAGELPNCAALRAEGTFAPLASTMPAESPVSWASLNSGRNPGETGIPGFIKRSFAPSGNPEPEPGHATHEARTLEALPRDGLKGFLARRSALESAVTGGVVTFVLFFVLLALLLRIRRGIALLLALFLGGVGAFGAWRARAYLPFEIADVVGNPTKSTGFFDIAARAGVQTIAIDAAMEWDRPDTPNLRLLAGLGVPDVRANNGDWFVYTSRTDELLRAPEGRPTSSGGRVFHVDVHDNKVESFVYGPKDYYRIDRAKRELKEIDAALARPGLSDAKFDRLTERRTEITTRELPRLECKDDPSGDPAGLFAGSEIGRASLPLAVELRGDKALVTIGGQSQEIAAGAWSDWFHLTFALNPLVKAKAITRCKLVSIQDPFELYVDFLQIDPADPLYWQPISRPPSFAKDLVRWSELPFETVGWACMTMPFKDREIDPVTFMQDIAFTHETRVKLLESAIARDDWRLFVDIESTPDRVQHMMYQYADEGHPGHDAAEAARTVRIFGRDVALKDAITESYRAVDRLVGDVVKNHLRPGDTLILCADHGFQSFRRQVHLNNWLAREGFLVLKPGVDRKTSTYLEYVDWSKTRAYALGLGGIYVNLRGREREGIVSPAEVPALLEDLSRKLSALRDDALDQPAVKTVYETGKIHSGPHVGAEADLIVGFEAGYRVSWATSTGNISLTEREGVLDLGDVVEDNLSNWSGDHVSVAADLVQGAFFCNRKIVIPPGGLDLLHVAPTVLSLLGVAIPAECDKPALEFER